MDGWPTSLQRRSYLVTSVVFTHSRNYKSHAGTVLMQILKLVSELIY